MLPTAAFPNATAVVLAFSDIVLATPVPESGIAVGEPGALLTSDTDPDTAPAAAGPKEMLNVLLVPAAIVEGMARPLMLNPAPDAVACETVRVALPVFCTRIVCEFGAPTVTLPKLTLAGVSTIVGCAPVPFSGIVVIGFGALLFIVSVPVSAPGTEGTSVAVKLVVWPAVSVNGVVNPLIAKPVPDTLVWDMVTLVDPPLVRLIVCDPVLPTAIFPKATVPGFAVNWP